MANGWGVGNSEPHPRPLAAFSGAALRHGLRARRRAVAGRGGRGLRPALGTGDEEGPVAHVPRLRRRALRTLGRDLERPCLQPARPPDVPGRPDHVPEDGGRHRSGSVAGPGRRGRPGFARVDTLHSGDRDDEEGAYVINMVDEVTQYQQLASVRRITEQFGVPVLEMDEEEWRERLNRPLLGTSALRDELTSSAGPCYCERSVFQQPKERSSSWLHSRLCPPKNGWSLGIHTMAHGPQRSRSDKTGWSRRYLLTSGCCYTHFSHLSPRNKEVALLSLAFQIVADGIPVDDVLGQFARIPEWRNMGVLLPAGWFERAFLADPDRTDWNPHNP